MVEHLKAMGELLDRRNLDDETVKEINVTIRHLLAHYKPVQEQKETSGNLDPFQAVKSAQLTAKELLGENTLNEWLNGSNESS